MRFPFPFITRGAHERALETAREAARHEQKDRAADSAHYLLNLAAAGATNIRLHGRNKILAEQLVDRPACTCGKRVSS